MERENNGKKFNIIPQFIQLKHEMITERKNASEKEKRKRKKKERQLKKDQTIYRTTMIYC